MKQSLFIILFSVATLGTIQAQKTIIFTFRVMPVSWRILNATKSLVWVGR